MAMPERNHYRNPEPGADAETALNQAVRSLRAARGLDPGDSAADLHLLASLIEQARTRLPHAVAATRADNYSWAEIGDLLGITRAAAWQRFGATNSPRSAHGYTPAVDQTVGNHQGGAV